MEFINFLIYVSAGLLIMPVLLLSLLGEKIWNVIKQFKNV
jgi:hypothetical protein